MQYVALLRGINVGGNNKVPMAELRSCLETAGFSAVQTYIQSGNVLFESDVKNEVELTETIERAMEATFGFPVTVAIFSAAEFRDIAHNTPDDWLQNPEWKYNYLFLKKPTTAEDVLAALGDQKPDIEYMRTGRGVVYQAISIQQFGRTTASKMIGTPIYKQMTIRNHNTVTKLVTLLTEA